MSHTPDARPDLTPALEALLADMGRSIPQLHGLRTADILVVGLGAHGTAVASVRSLDAGARTVRIDGVRRRIELGLRPGFLLHGDAPRRAITLIHELLHLDAERPGQLLESKRHRVRSHASHEAEARTLGRAYLKEIDPVRLLCLAHEGEVLLRQWKVRPCDETSHRRFTDRDVFHGPVLMKTPPAARGGWW